MAGYILIDSDITDEALFGEFADKVGDVVEAHGGKYLVRAGATEVVRGDFTPHRVVIIEFESVERARAYVNSSEYAPLAEILERSASSSIIIVEGV